MIDRNKSNTKLTIILIIAIVSFLGMGQLKIISADVAVSASGLCIVSLIMLVIKDIVISNRNKDSEDSEKNDDSGNTKKVEKKKSKKSKKKETPK